MKLIEKAYRENADSLWRFVRRRLNDDESAFDITQETFLRLLKSKEIKEGSERAWLYTTARRLIIDRYRKQSKIPVSYGDEQEAEEVNDFQPDELLLKKEDLKWLSRELNSLPEEDQDLLELKYVSGMDLDEIAGILEISEVNARVRIHRLRLELKRRYNESLKTI